MLNEPPAADDVLRENAPKQLAEVFHVLSLPVRLRIVLRLAAGECNVGTLQNLVNIPQPQVSHHLTVLRSAGLVTNRRASKQIFYRLSGPAGIDGVTIDLPEVRIRISLRPASPRVPSA